jgi:hypothetical protein
VPIGVLNIRHRCALCSCDRLARPGIMLPVPRPTAPEPGPPCDVCGDVVVVLDITEGDVRQACANGHPREPSSTGWSWFPVTFGDRAEGDADA